ncbi:MAG TPA: hypothetical protein VFW94_13890 [Candidatus Acidoferrales bacterium]|nr:hypothetical protein [Candidatus Acidoferrales bacterium]
MLVKMYGNDRPQADVRYRPADYIGCKEIRVEGRPNSRHISTSFAERQNLTMRMQIRRFTWLDECVLKEGGNHIAAIALHYMCYNFCRVHQTLRVTPAMESGITDHICSIKDIVDLLENRN